jgi:hypothetical protein
MKESGALFILVPIPEGERTRSNGDQRNGVKLRVRVRLRERSRKVLDTYLGTPSCVVLSHCTSERTS